MLKMKPNCECCDRDLPADQSDAWICSFECTFCTNCMEQMFNHTCPNCNGPMSKRPVRSGDNLVQHPASVEKVSSRYESISEQGRTTFKRTRILPQPAEGD